MIDISRGDILVKELSSPSVSKNIKAIICWLSEEKLNQNRPYKIMQTTRLTKAKITKIINKFDINNMISLESNEIETNDISNIELTLAQPIVGDNYSNNRKTGSFILIDDSTNHTVGAGMITEFN